MATKEQIKQTILAIAGDPSVGEIYSLADKWADAIWKLDNKDVAVKVDSDKNSGASAYAAIKETRIIEPTEKRIP
jgi:hypothetical protein